MGTWQPPPIRCRKARSTRTHREVTGSSRVATTLATAGSSIRASMARAPCPIAGITVSTSMYRVMRSANPILIMPAAASMTPDIFSVSILRRRV